MEYAKHLKLFGGERFLYGNRHSSHFAVLFLYFFINVFSSIGHQSELSASLYTSELKKNNYHEWSCFVGQLCEYIIPVTDFNCESEKIVVSRVGVHKLPRWLLFKEDVGKLTGIPFNGDDEILEILVVALTRLPNTAHFHVCGSSQVKINIWALRYLSLFAGTAFNEIKSSRAISDGDKNACGEDISIILASLSFSVNFSALNGEERRLLFTNLTSIYEITSKNVFLLTKRPPNGNPFSELLDSSYVISSGSFADGNSSATRRTIYLTWFIQCGMIEINHAIFKDIRLREHSGKWFMVKKFNITLNRWFVVQGFQRRKVIRRRRNIVGGTTTATYASAITSPGTVVTTRITKQTSSDATDVPTRTFSPPTTFPSFKSPSISQSSTSSQWFTSRSRDVSWSEITPSFTATTFRTSSHVSPSFTMSNSDDTTSSSITSAGRRTKTTILFSSSPSADDKYNRTTHHTTVQPSLSLTRHTSKVHYTNSTLTEVKSTLTSKPSKASTHPPVYTSTLSTPVVSDFTRQPTYSLISSLQTSYTGDGSDITHSSSSSSIQHGNLSITQSPTKSPITSTQSDTPLTSGSDTTVTTATTSQTTFATGNTEASYNPTSGWLSGTDQVPSFTAIVSIGSRTTETSHGASSKSISNPTIKPTPTTMDPTRESSTTSLYSGSISPSEFSKPSHHTPSISESHTETRSITTSIASTSERTTTNSYGTAISSSEHSKSLYDTLLTSVLPSATQSTPITSAGKGSSTNSYSEPPNSSGFLRSSDYYTLSKNQSHSKTQSKLISTASTSKRSPVRSFSESSRSSDSSSTGKRSTSITSIFTTSSPISTTIHVDTSSMESRHGSITTQHRQSSTHGLTTLQCTSESLSLISRTPLVETAWSSTTACVSLYCSSLTSNYTVSPLTSNDIASSPTSNNSVNTGLFSSVTTDSVTTIWQNSTSSVPITYPTVQPNSPPKVYNGFDLLTITFGKIFRVQVPADTFHDREDGDTRQLLLNCVTKDHKPLSTNSWLQFNPTSQEFYGIALRSDSRREFITEYLLVATDSTGNQAYEAFMVHVKEDSDIPAVEYKLKISNTNVKTFTENLDSILLLAKKIARFYTDKDTSLIKVQSIEDGSIWFTWTNTTVKTCNIALIEKITSKITDADNEIQPEFREWLLPEFNAVNVYENKTGACRPTTLKPIAESLSSTDDKLWLKFLIPALIIAFLVIIVVIVCFVFRRHAGVKVLKADERIFRRRKPVILDDEREMTGLSSKPVQQFDDSSIGRPDQTLADDSYGENDDSLDEYPTPLGEKPPPMYESPHGDAGQKRTPPPPYKLPPSY